MARALLGLTVVRFHLLTVMSVWPRATGHEAGSSHHLSRRRSHLVTAHPWLTSAIVMATSPGDCVLGPDTLTCTAITGPTRSSEAHLVASRVVAAAAIIMNGVFAGFIFNADPMIKQFGFALAFGILAAAFLVGLTLMPAVMDLLGDRAWTKLGLGRIPLNGVSFLRQARAARGPPARSPPQAALPPEPPAIPRTLSRWDDSTVGAARVSGGRGARPHPC